MRYIDADKILKQIEPPMNWTDSEAELQQQADYQIFENLIENAPTEDVVPRAEVEAIEEERDRYKKYYFRHEYDKWEAEIKQEVANKIVNIVADLMWQGESEKLNISIGGVYCNKQEFIQKIKKYIGENKNEM